MAASMGGLGAFGRYTSVSGHTPSMERSVAHAALRINTPVLTLTACSVSAQAAGAAAVATPYRSATRSTMSPMIREISKSFGV